MKSDEGAGRSCYARRPAAERDLDLAQADALDQVAVLGDPPGPKPK